MALNELVQLSLTLRIQQVVERHIKGVEGDFVILGMDPDPQCPCHPAALMAIYGQWSSEAQTPVEKTAVDEAYERVEQEFANWDA